MRDNNDLLKAIKRIAIEAIEASKPTSVVYGAVISTEPLKINVEQKITLTDAQLVLTRNVMDYDVEMTVDHFTENDNYLNTTHSHPTVGNSSFDSTHKHAYKGKKLFTVHNGLVVGDKVIMIRMQGGQKFVILDRVVT